MRRILFTLACVLALASPAVAQIAHSNTTDGGISGGGTSHTFAHDCESGTDRYLLVAIGPSGPVGAVTGITYNGDALTFIDDAVDAGGGGISLWGMAAPDTGTNDVVISFGSGQFTAAVASCFEGVDQAGQPEATNTGTEANATSLSIAVTPTTNDSWVIGGMGAGSGSGAAAGTDTTLLGGNNPYAQMLHATGDPSPTSSTTLQATIGDTRSWGGVVVALAPAGGGGGGPTCNGGLLLLGAGGCE